MRLLLCDPVCLILRAAVGSKLCAAFCLVHEARCVSNTVRGSVSYSVECCVFYAVDAVGFYCGLLLCAAVCSILWATVYFILEAALCLILWMLCA